MEFREEQETFPSSTWERGEDRTDPSTSSGWRIVFFLDFLARARSRPGRVLTTTPMRLSLLGLFLVLPGFAALPAKTVNFPGDNFSIMIPDTWTTSPTESRLFLATDANHTAMADITSLPNSDNASVSDPNFIKGVKAGLK